MSVIEMIAWGVAALTVSMCVVLTYLLATDDEYWEEWLMDTTVYD